MLFQELKGKLIALFENGKLDGRIGVEWEINGKDNSDIKKIGYATNLTPDTIKKAIENNVDFIITHHDAWGFVYGMKAQCQILLEENNIGNAFFHLPLDDAIFGTSSSLAKALKLENTSKDVPYDEIFRVGVIGELEDFVPFESFTENLSNILEEPVRAFKNNSSNVKKICIVTGGGNMTDCIKVAVDNNCDTYITGEYSLYSQQYSKFAGINLIVGSHTNTEILGVAGLVGRLTENTDIETIKLLEENY